MQCSVSTLSCAFMPLMAVHDAACSVAMGFDDGAVMIKIGREEPVASMDASGKIIWARHNEIQTVNIKSLGGEYDEASLVRPHLLPDLALALPRLHPGCRVSVDASSMLQAGARSQ